MAETENGACFVGGGSGGVGSEICREFARRGKNVAFSYWRNAAKADELLAELKSLGVDAAALQLDLTNAGATSAALEHTVSRFGGLDSVIYAAGPAFDMDFVSRITPETWSKTVSTDINGCFNLFSAALKQMRVQRRGALLALSTCGLKRPPKADVLSAAPKAAIDMLVKCIAKEEGRNNIRANTVELGFIEAGLAAHHMQHTWTLEVIESIRNQTPLRRFGQALDIARAVVFLCSDEASFITGQALAVDGGFQL